MEQQAPIYEPKCTFPVHLKFAPDPEITTTTKCFMCDRIIIDYCVKFKTILSTQDAVCLECYPSFRNNEKK